MIIASCEVSKHQERKRRVCASRYARGPLFVLIALLLASIPAHAQNQSQRLSSTQNSELGRENLSHVSASAGEIKVVLIRDIGLMVELKRWVAKDATDHGQIITDADLTDDAILDRLEQDAQFRAVATELLQRYGYLVPQLNPNSEQAKEHELLVMERTKWIAQHE